MEQPSTWLLNYQANIYSQSGEDGIIEKILDTLPETNKWCVEFGALDGKHLSNTRNLIENRGYSAVLIEANEKFFGKLQAEYADNQHITTIHDYVGFSNSDNLDSILSKTEIPVDYDFLSIDVDGNDYHIWKAASHYQPKSICIEFNSTIPNEVEYVQAADPATSQGSSLSSLVQLGKAKGYELVSVIGVNALFVKSEYYPLFQIKDNSIESLRTNQDDITYLFCGYDGTILLSGNRKLPWHGLEIKSRKIQLLPRFLRNYPGNYNFVQILLFGIYLLFSNPQEFKKRFSAYIKARNR